MQTLGTKGFMLKEGLFNQYNVIMVGGCVLLSLAAASPLPTIAAAAGEAAWLLFGVRSDAFKRWVVQQQRREKEKVWQLEIEAAAAGADASAIVRLRMLGGTLMELVHASAERGSVDFTASIQARLKALLQAYAILAAAQQRLQKLVGAGGLEAVDAEVARLGQALSEERDPTVRISLRQALALTQRRLKKYEQVEGMRRDVTVKMATFEAAVEFVRMQMRADEPEHEIFLALDEMLAGAHIDSQAELDVVRVFGERRLTTSGMHAIVPPVAQTR